jgi:Ni/Fe-hydrogenase subunit HybB-like protein
MSDTTKILSDSEGLQHLEKIKADLKPIAFGKAGKIWVWVLSLICVVALYAFTKQLREGLGVTGMRDFTSWGIYVSNFVFFVAISLVGSLISAVLKLANVKWRTPLTRISEVIAFASILFASIIIVVDMGRPERLLNIFFHGRIQSPIVWDVIVIMTYMAISALLLYLPLVPDIKLYQGKNDLGKKWHVRLFKLLGLRWKFQKEQLDIVKRSIGALAILIIPVALTIHTVTSWLFATTYRSGWDSTNFGAYFVSGAFLLGAGGVIAAMYILRRQYNLKEYITDLHFDRMGKLMVMLALVYLYFSVNEYFVPGYKMKKVEGEHIQALFVGKYSGMFWTVQIFGLFLPILIMLFKKGRRPGILFIISGFVIVAAWFKRFLIVIPTLIHPFIPIQDVPESWKFYVPTWEEWAITIGSLAGALLVIILLIRIFPIIPVWEIAEEEGVSNEVMIKASQENENQD